MARTTSPASSSNTTASPIAAPNKVPRSATETAVPTLGWPANGSSAAGVKIRTRAVVAAFSGGNTNVVSDRLNSAAMRCMSVVDRASAPYTTATGLPPNAWSVNTSNVSNST